MTVKEIQDLIKLVNESGLIEFKMRDGDFQLSMRTKSFDESQTSKNQPTIIPVTNALLPQTQQVAASPPVEATPVESPQAAEPTTKAKEENYLEIKSPIVGTFYRSPSPEKEVFVKVGDTVNVGDTVCIVEAMKLFNEIESEVSGKIVKVLVEDATPVEYDQVLFLVESNK